MSDTADETPNNCIDLRSHLITTKLTDNLARQGLLEDSIFSNIEKLEALCAARTALDASEIEISRSVMSNYSAVVEQCTKELRGLLNEYFD